jgi:hypothetical protein
MGGGVSARVIPTEDFETMNKAMDEWCVDTIRTLAIFELWILIEGDVGGKSRLI